MHLTYFDLASAVILLFFAFRGASRGFIDEVSGLLGLAAGLVLARSFSVQVSDLFKHFLADHAAPAAAFIALFLVGMLLVGLVARILRRALDFAFANWLNTLGGIAVGLIKGCLLACIMAYAGLMLIPHFQLIKDSVSIPYLMEAARHVIAALSISIPMP